MVTDMNLAALKPTFIVGESIQWLHGESIRVATVLEIEEDRVFVSGMHKNYWIKKKTVEKTLNGHPKVMSQGW